jgi:hypothetical protein
MDTSLFQISSAIELVGISVLVIRTGIRGKAPKCLKSPYPVLMLLLSSFFAFLDPVSRNNSIENKQVA